MVVRVFDIHKWATLAPGEVLQLKGDGRRQIRVDVNCPKPTRWDVVEDGKPVFLAVVFGKETLEFSVGDKVDAMGTPPTLVPWQDPEVVGEPTEVWYFTNKPETAESDAVSFTRIDPRPARNRELELIMWKQRRASERMMQRQQQQLDLMAAELAGLKANAETGELDAEAPDAGSGSEGGAAPEGAAAGAAALEGSVAGT